MPTIATQLTDSSAPGQRTPGAPLNNTNGFRHGLRGSNLPPGCAHIQRATCHFRRQLEAAVVAARGEINLVDAAYVNTAYRCERHAQLAQRWLAVEAESMSPADRLSYSREVARASGDRDKAIAALALPSRPNADPWSALQSNLRNGDAASRDDKGTSVQVAALADNAAEGRTEAHDG